MCPKLTQAEGFILGVGAVQNQAILYQNIIHGIIYLLRFCNLADAHKNQHGTQQQADVHRLAEEHNTRNH